MEPLSRVEHNTDTDTDMSMGAEEISRSRLPTSLRDHPCFWSIQTGTIDLDGTALPFTQITQCRQSFPRVLSVSAALGSRSPTHRFPMAAGSAGACAI